MTNAEIQKLLAGYATNTLSDAERQALFRAALEDQNVFNELHGEQALKDLLDDPISRQQIRQALEEPAAGPAWWLRGWVWTAAASAVAATVLVVAVTRSRAPYLSHEVAALKAPAPAIVTPPVEKSADAAKTKTVAGAPAAKKTNELTARREIRARSASAQNERKDTLAIASPQENAAAPAPAVLGGQQVTAQAPAPPPTAPPSPGRAGDTQAQNQQAQFADSVRDQEQGLQRQSRFAVSGSVAMLKARAATIGGVVLMKNEGGSYEPLAANKTLSTGDEVRLVVTPATSGNLSLSLQDQSGNWKRVFPAVESDLPVNAGSRYTIPDAPIVITAADQHYRITLMPSATDVKLITGARAKAKATPARKESTTAAPLTLELTIGPKKAP